MKKCEMCNIILAKTSWAIGDYRCLCRRCFLIAKDPEGVANMREPRLLKWGTKYGTRGGVKMFSIEYPEWKIGEGTGDIKNFVLYCFLTDEKYFQAYYDTKKEAKEKAEEVFAAWCKKTGLNPSGQHAAACPCTYLARGKGRS